MPEEITKIKHANVRLGTFILLIILVAIAFGGAGYLYGINAGKAITAVTATPTASVSATTSKTAVSSATSTADVTANWKTYTNEKYGYSFKYPANVKLTASKENSDNLEINATADGVNVFPSSGTVGNGIFYVSAPGIDFTTTAIKNQFSSTRAEDISVTSATISGASSYKVVISGDSSVVSTFYFVRLPSNAVLELTVLNSSSDAENILSTFQFTK